MSCSEFNEEDLSKRSFVYHLQYFKIFKFNWGILLWASSYFLLGLKNSFGRYEFGLLCFWFWLRRFWRRLISYWTSILNFFIHWVSFVFCKACSLISITGFTFISPWNISWWWTHSKLLLFKLFRFLLHFKMTLLVLSFFSFIFLYRESISGIVIVFILTLRFLILFILRN